MKLSALLVAAALALPSLASAATWNYTSTKAVDQKAVEAALKAVPGAKATVNGTNVTVTAPEGTDQAKVTAALGNIGVTTAATTTTTTAAPTTGAAPTTTTTPKK